MASPVRSRCTQIFLSVKPQFFCTLPPALILNAGFAPELINLLCFLQVTDPHPGQLQEGDLQWYGPWHSLLRDQAVPQVSTKPKPAKLVQVSHTFWFIWYKQWFCYEFLYYYSSIYLANLAQLTLHLYVTFLVLHARASPPPQSLPLLTLFPPF